MFAVLKAMHYVSLLLVCGGPVFWLAVWRPVYGNAAELVSRRVAARVRLGVVPGAVLFVLSGVAEAVRAASQVVDVTSVAELWLFLSASRYGQMSLLKAGLTPVFVGAFFLTFRQTSKRVMACTAAIGLGVLCTISLTSHAAARPDTVPLLSDIVHLLAAVIWGGGLLYFASLPWHLLRTDLTQHTRSLGQLMERFSTLALVAVLALAATGSIAAFLHVYGPAALTITPYGRALLGKLTLFGLALGIAGMHLLVIAPALKQQAQRFVPARATRMVRHLQRLVQLEAALVMSGMVLAGALTTFSPAERPGNIVRKDWQRQVGTIQMHLSMTPTNDIGGIQFEVLLQRPDGRPVPRDTQVSLYMRMVDHDMGQADIVATPVAPGRYSASGLVSMAGDWQVDVRLQPPQEPATHTMLDFNAPTGALDLGRLRRVDFAPIAFSWLHTLSFVLGGLIVSLAGFMIWASKQGKLPLWATPIGLLFMAGGGALGLRVVLVDAYPTTYLRNPVPFQAAVVHRGGVLFQTHCAVCHGPEGRGNGPAATGLNPPPADLTAAHVEDHTDGDIFWWLTHGIAGTAMPSFDQILPASARWELIHYVRSLRQGGPETVATLRAPANPLTACWGESSPAVSVWRSAVGAAIAVLLAFAMLAVFVHRAPRRVPRHNLLQWPVGRLVAHPIVLGGVRILAVGLFVILLIAGLLGQQTPTKNIAPTLVWVIGWIGLVSVTAVFGNLWALINPWQILYDWATWFTRRVFGVRQSTYVPYPRPLGIWPGVLLFGVFAWLQLVYEGAVIPARLSMLLLLYSGLTWSGMFLFSKDVWLRHGDPLSLAFRWVSRFAITDVRVTDTTVTTACHLNCRDQQGESIDCYACFAKARPSRRQWNLRPVAAGLLQDEVLSVSDMMFVLVLLGTVTFDGLLATPLWADIEIALQGYLPGDGQTQRVLLRTLGLLGVPLLLLECYVLIGMFMALASGQRVSWAILIRQFTVTLVPIAIAYHLAHYLAFLLVQGQAFLPLLSDPFGWGWNVFGSADFRINFALVEARSAWLAAVVIIGAGHISAISLAYLVALRMLRERPLVQRSQYPMLTLLGASTVVSLWMLASPILDDGPPTTANPGAPATAVLRAAKDSARPLEAPPLTLLPPGFIVEHCLALTPDDTLSFSFQASRPLRFNMHYHRAGQLHFSIGEHMAQAETHTFTPSVSERYCLMWANASPKAVELSLRLMQTKKE
jgi:putative copper export protein/mono/diheme cytochrome c family protein